MHPRRSLLMHGLYSELCHRSLLFWLPFWLCKRTAAATAREPGELISFCPQPMDNSPGGVRAA